MEKQCLASFYSKDARRDITAFEESKNWKPYLWQYLQERYPNTWFHYVSHHLGISLEGQSMHEQRKLFDALKIEDLIELVDRTGGALEFYIWFRMHGLRTQQDYRERIKQEKMAFNESLAKSAATLATRKRILPQSSHDFKWLVKQCQKKKYQGGAPCDKVLQFYSTKCLH